MSANSSESKRPNPHQRPGSQQARRPVGRRDVRRRNSVGPGAEGLAPASKPPATQGDPPKPAKKDEAQGEVKEKKPAREGEEDNLSADENHKNLLDNIFTTYSGEEILRKMDTMFVGQVGMHPLLCAVTTGHQVGLQKLLEAGVDINQQHPPGQSTALHMACKSRQPKMVETLLAANADAAMLDSDGNNAFMLAIESGFCMTLNIMWENRTRYNINQCNKCGKTALHLAAQMAWSCAVSMLLTEGANINAASFDGSTALMLAARRGDQNTVEVLVKGGANLLMEDNDDCTAICGAVEDNQIEIAKYLIGKLSSGQREEYIKRRIELLYILPNTDETDTYYEEVVYPVFRLICHNSQCRIVLHRHRLIPFWISAIQSHLENENATDKGFHGLLECLCSGSDPKDDGDESTESLKFNHCFVDQFLKNKGTDLVMSALNYYKSSNSPELVAASMLPLLTLVDSASGRKWLEKEYYKITQFIGIFEKEYEDLDYAAGMKNKVGTLWNNFKEMLSGIQAVQAEIHGAELVACEEREKARRERKREKKRQRRQLQKAKVTQLTAQYAACSLKASEEFQAELTQKGTESSSMQETCNLKTKTHNLERCSSNPTNNVVSFAYVPDGSASDTSFEEVVTRRQAKELRKMKAMKSEENLPSNGQVKKLKSIAESAVARDKAQESTKVTVSKKVRKPEQRESTPERWDAEGDHVKDGISPQENLSGNSNEVFTSLVTRSVIQRLRDFMKDETMSKKAIFCSRKPDQTRAGPSVLNHHNSQLHPRIPKSIVYFEIARNRLRPWIELGHELVIKYTHEAFGELSVLVISAHSPPVVSPSICNCGANPGANQSSHKGHCVKSAFDVPLLCILETEEEKMRELVMILEACYNLLAFADTPENIGQQFDCNIGYTFKHLKGEFEERYGCSKRFPDDMVMIFILNDKFIQIIEPEMIKGVQFQSHEVQDNTLALQQGHGEVSTSREHEGNPFMSSISRCDFEPISVSTQNEATTPVAQSPKSTPQKSEKRGKKSKRKKGTTLPLQQFLRSPSTPVHLASAFSSNTSNDKETRPRTLSRTASSPQPSVPPLLLSPQRPDADKSNALPETNSVDSKGCELETSLKCLAESLQAVGDASGPSQPASPPPQGAATIDESTQRETNVPDDGSNPPQTEPTADEFPVLEADVSVNGSTLPQADVSVDESALHPADLSDNVSSLPQASAILADDEQLDEQDTYIYFADCDSVEICDITVEKELATGQDVHAGDSANEASEGSVDVRGSHGVCNLPVESVAFTPEQENALEAVQIEFGSVNFQIFSSSGIYQPEFMDGIQNLPEEYTVSLHSSGHTDTLRLADGAEVVGTTTNDEDEASNNSAHELNEGPRNAPEPVEVSIRSTASFETETFPKTQLLDLSNLSLEEEEVEFARLTPDPDVLYDDDDEEEDGRDFGAYTRCPGNEFLHGRDPLLRLLEAQRDLVRKDGEEIYGYDPKQRPMTRHLWPDLIWLSQQRVRDSLKNSEIEDTSGPCHYWLPSGLLDIEDCSASGGSTGSESSVSTRKGTSIATSSMASTVTYTHVC